MDIDEVMVKINARYQILKTWQAVADELKIPRGTVNRIAKGGYEPQDLDVRRAVGLSVLIPTAPCAECSDCEVSPKTPLPRCPRTAQDGRYGFEPLLLPLVFRVLYLYILAYPYF